MVGFVVGCGLWVGVVVGQWWLWIGMIVGCGLWIGVVVGCGLWVVGCESAWLGRGRGSASWDEAGRWSWIGS